MFCVVLAVSSVMLLGSVRAQGSSAAKVFTDPLTVQATDLDQTFIVNVNVSDFVDLYGW